MDVNKQPNENYISYWDRLINAKENNLIDIDKSELWELATTEKLSSEESRKRTYGLKTIVKILKEENETNISEDAVIKRIVEERQRLEEEKVKMKDQRRELNKLIAEKARFEHIKDCIQETASIISKEKVLSWKQPSHIISDREGVVLFSDWHSENEVNNFLNKFNKDEFLRRIDRLVMKTIEYGKLHNISKLHVINLGDLLSGIIHIVTRISNREDVS